MEITKYNIDSHLDDIIKNINTSVFVSLDAEFSGLKINEIYKNSLFDSAADRYAKIRKGTDGIIATQVGISTFHFNRDDNAYKSATYTFQLCPQAIGSINQCFTFEASALEFLSHHKFDFNKIMYEGIPYLNKFEEELLKRDIDNECLEAYTSNEDMEQILSCGTTVEEWLQSPQKDSNLTLSGFPCYCYLLTKKIKKDFPQLNVINNGYEVKISMENVATADKTSEEEKLLKLATGFSNVVKELVNAKKPLVLHNALTDLIIFSNQFLEPLPSRYDSFKNHIHEIFPVIYDTKFISNDMKFLVKKDQFSESTSLEKLYEFFKDSKGRNLAFNSPLVKMFTGYDPTPCFHQAGWDSFCTGYCFIRLCHWAASNKFDIERAFTSTEHLYSIKKYANNIYLSRAAQPHICFGQDDPSTHRPEFLFVETLGRERINISQVISSLSKFGSVDVKQYGKTCALVAVTNNICAKKILCEFKQNHSWNIAKYNMLKHSRMARIALWSGVVVSSGSLLALILHRIGT